MYHSNAPGSPAYLSSQYLALSYCCFVFCFAGSGWAGEEASSSALVRASSSASTKQERP